MEINIWACSAYRKERTESSVVVVLAGNSVSQFPVESVAVRGLTWRH